MKKEKTSKGLPTQTPPALLLLLSCLPPWEISPTQAPLLSLHSIPFSFPQTKAFSSAEAMVNLLQETY